MQEDKMKRLLIFCLIAALFLVSQVGARSPFNETIDTAVDNKKMEKECQWSKLSTDPQPQQERNKFKEEINKKIPTSITKSETKGSDIYNPVNAVCKSEKQMLASSVNCTPWNMQPNGCYERVCCCDKNGASYCERCCPDSSGKCTAHRVKC